MIMFYILRENREKSNDWFALVIFYPGIDDELANNGRFFSKCFDVAVDEALLTFLVAQQL